MSEEKVICAGASWCGFSKKFEKQIKDEGVADKFKVVHCDLPEYKDTDICKNVTGFPTFKTTNKEKAKDKTLDGGFGECHVGFGDTKTILGDCS